MKTKPVVITTQPEQQASRLLRPLEQAGICVYNLPSIQIKYSRPKQKHRNILEKLETFNLLIFTSRNGVVGFFRILEAISGNTHLPGHLKIAVIGESTANEVGKYQHTVHYTGKGTSSLEFSEFLHKKVLMKGDHLLLVQGSRAPLKLRDSLMDAASLDRMDVYETILPEQLDPVLLQRAKKQEADLSIFTSPSAFQNFIGLTEIQPDAYSMPVAAIGKTTGDSISSMGYRVDLVSRKQDYASFAKEIINYLYPNT